MSVSSDRLYRTDFMRNYNNLSSIYVDILPNDVKEVITWSEFILANVPLVSSALNKMSTVSVTSFQYKSEDLTEMSSSDADSWKNIVEVDLKMLRRVRELAFTFLSSGNIFVSVYYPQARELECENCSEKLLQQKFKVSHGLSPRVMDSRAGSKSFVEPGGLYFIGRCPKCREKTRFKYKDTIVKAVKRVNIISWPAVNMQIEDDPITGRANYYYAMPGSLRSSIMGGNIDKLFNQLPEIIISAVNKKLVKFDDSKILHKRSRKLDGASTGWGMPILTSAIPDMISLLLLRKGQQRILSDMIFPLRGVTPRTIGNDGNAIYNYMDGSDVKGKIESMLRAHVKNPTDIKYFPIPLDTISAFGEGKQMNLSSELDEASIMVMNSIGVPVEFVKGGLSYTTGGASLRLLETELSSLVESMEDVVNFVVAGVGGLLNKAPVSITLTPFKILDDMAEKQLLLGLFQAGKISDHTLSTYFKLDSQAEKERQVEENKSEILRGAKVQKFQQSVSQSLEEKAKTEAMMTQSSSQQLNQEALKMEADQMAQQFMQMNSTQKTSEMDSLQKNNFVLWAMVKASLEIAGRKNATMAASQAQQGQGGQPQ